MLVVKLPGFFQNAKHINSQLFFSIDSLINKLFNNSCIYFTVYDLCYGTLEGKDVRKLAATMQKKKPSFFITLPTFQASSRYQKAQTSQQTNLERKQTQVCWSAHHSTAVWVERKVNSVSTKSGNVDTILKPYLWKRYHCSKRFKSCDVWHLFLKINSQHGKLSSLDMILSCENM